MTRQESCEHCGEWITYYRDPDGIWAERLLSWIPLVSPDDPRMVILNAVIRRMEHVEATLRRGLCGLPPTLPFTAVYDPDQEGES